MTPLGKRGSDRASENTGLRFGFHVQRRHDDLVARMRSILSEEEAEAARARGASMNHEQMMDFSIEVLESAREATGHA